MYAVKLGPNGEEKYKARFVAKGYSQIPNVEKGLLAAELQVIILKETDKQKDIMG